MPCTLLCNHQSSMVSVLKAPTATECREFTLPCQPDQSTEKQMLPEPALPRHLDPQRLEASQSYMSGQLLSLLPASLKLSRDCGFFPPLEPLDHVHMQQTLAEYCSFPTTAKGTTSQLLCMCTKASLAATQTQNGAYTFSPRQWVLSWRGWSEINMAPSTSTGSLGYC